jgi:hypothetical protein
MANIPDKTARTRKYIISYKMLLAETETSGSVRGHQTSDYFTAMTTFPAARPDST